MNRRRWKQSAALEEKYGCELALGGRHALAGEPRVKLFTMKTELFELIKMRHVVKDVATGISGAVRLIAVGMDRGVMYSIQPKGLNTEKQPLKPIWLAPQRIRGAQTAMTELPFGVLGTKVRDTVTGFSGTAVNLFIYESGCVHVEIQPEGTGKGGEFIQSMDIDILRLEGKALEPEPPEKAEKARKEKPSPGTRTSILPRVS